jgi:hypothetical protein
MATEKTDSSSLAWVRRAESSRPKRQLSLLKNLFGHGNGWQVKITSDDILQLKRTSPQL